jgi:hypothetical protein
MVFVGDHGANGVQADHAEIINTHVFSDAFLGVASQVALLARVAVGDDAFEVVADGLVDVGDVLVLESLREVRLVVQQFLLERKERLGCGSLGKRQGDTDKDRRGDREPRA